MMTIDFFDSIHAEKYRGEGEDFREWSNRHASALKDSDEHFRAYRSVVRDQRFLPGGRVQSAMGSPRQVTGFNCYVMPTIQDTFVDGPDSIMDVAAKAAQTMRMGGGVGYDFSTLRPRGSRIASLGSRSSGPIAFMEIYDAVCRAVMSAGHRRGAQMAVLRIDHPDIEEFVRAKQNTTRLTGFNVSIAVTDQFMRHLKRGEPFPLCWGGREYERINPAALWEEIMRSTWDWAEPGILFIDRINEMNNLYYCEEIAATNPCGEQPLPPNGACLLGSFNLPQYMHPGGRFDYEQFHADIPHVVRAMDNVIDRTIYPLPEQETEAKMKRRMGLGVTGLANALESMGMKYGSVEFLAEEENIMAALRANLYRASALLAAEKGAFPLYDRDKYLAGRFVRDLPKNVRDLIAQHGIRNSHLTSIAPTGTISLAAGNVSSGIEPPFALSYTRQVTGFDGVEIVDVQDYAYRTWGVEGKTAAECSVDDHLHVLAVAQWYVDSACSKTININPSMPWEEFKDVYMKAWELGCKGVTTFNPGGKRMGILTAPSQSESDGGACRIDPETGTRSCDE